MVAGVPLCGSDFDLGRATRIVRRVVDRMILLFAGYPDLGEDDLLQIGVLAAARDWPRFDGRRSAASTFIYRVARCELLDLFRSRRRGRAREEKVARPELSADAECAGFLAFEDAAWLEMPLPEWLRHVYCLALHRYPAQQIRRHRKFIKPEQAAAVAALMLRLEMNPKQVRYVMGEAPELQAAVKMRHLPTLRWFQEVGGMIPLAKRRLRRITERERAAADTGPKRAA